MVSRLCDDGVQGRDGRCVENNSCFQIFLFVPVCILLLGSPAGLISFSTSFPYVRYGPAGPDRAWKSSKRLPLVRAGTDKYEVQFCMAHKHNLES